MPLHLIKSIFRLRAEGRTISNVAHVTGIHRETVYKYDRMSLHERAEILRLGGLQNRQLAADSLG